MPRLSVFLFFVLLAAGCQPAEPPPSYVVRLGDEYLTEDDLRAAISSLPPTLDSVAVRQQVIDQWINNRLLAREARRRKLQEQPEVVDLLAENERSVLISALLEALYDESDVTFTPAELEAEYEANKEQLRLREPYVRIRYLRTDSLDDAEAARSALVQTMQNNTADSMWTPIVRQYGVGDNVEVALSFANTFVPVSQLFPSAPVLHQRLAAMGEGETAPVIEHGAAYHVLQLVERVDPGTVPERIWIEQELRQRLVVRRRRDLYDRTLSQLYSRAQASETLDIR